MKIDFTKTNAELVKLEATDKIDQDFEAPIVEFTDYYKVQSQYDLQEGLAKTYLLKIDGSVLGYVSIAMAHLKKENTEIMKAKETDGNIPALLISHIATHKNHLREGIATQLVDEVLSIATKQSSFVGCRYLMLHPRDDEIVRKFYKDYGFTYLPSMMEDKERDAFILDILTVKPKR